MDSKVYKRTPIKYPILDKLLPETRDYLSQANSILREFSKKNWPLQDPRAFCTTEKFNELFRHPLSDHYSAWNDYRVPDERTNNERDAVEPVETLLRNHIANADVKCKPSELFQESSSLVLGIDSKIRSGSIGVCQDINGSRVIFISQEELNPALNKLEKYIKNKLTTSPDILGAVTVAAALLNAHPLTDGNGRLSRILMNVFFQCRRHNYVPLYEFHTNSAGGFVIRLRAAEIFNEWDEIVQFYCRVIFCMACRDIG